MNTPLLLPTFCDSVLQREIVYYLERQRGERKRITQPQFGAPINRRDYYWYYYIGYNGNGRELPAVQFLWYLDKVVIQEHALILRGSPYPIEYRDRRELPAYSFYDFNRIFKQVYGDYGIGYSVAMRYPHPELLPRQNPVIPTGRIAPEGRVA